MSDQLETLLSEQRRFPTTVEFASRSAATAALYAAGKSPEQFWEDQAKSLEWMSPWSQVLDWKPPHAKWFVGGKLNVSVNCLDRHLRGPRRNKAAIIWEGEPGDRRVLTYWDMAREVGRCANALKRLGRAAGRPGRDLPARWCPRRRSPCSPAPGSARCTRWCSAGSRAESLRDRINDAGAVALITADGGYRRGQILPLKRMADAAHGAGALDQALHRGRAGSGARATRRSPR